MTKKIYPASELIAKEVNKLTKPERQKTNDIFINKECEKAAKQLIKRKK